MKVGIKKKRTAVKNRVLTHKLTRKGNASINKTILKYRN